MPSFAFGTVGMETNMTFDEMAESAKKSFAADPENFVPYFFVRVPDRTLMIPANVEDNDEKQAMLETLRIVFAVIGVDDYYVVTDTWAVTVTPGDELPSGSYKDVPGRVEALSVMHVQRDGSKVTLFPYQRTDYGIMYTDKPMLMDSKNNSLGGRYTELLAPKQIIEQVPQHTKDDLKPLLDHWTVQLNS